MAEIGQDVLDLFNDDDDVPPPMSVIVPVVQDNPLIQFQAGSFNDSEAENDSSTETEEDDDDSEKDDWLWTEWRTCECLICPYTAMGSEAIVSHMEAAHDVSLKALRKEYDMDHLSFVKMVNWQRSLVQFLPDKELVTSLRQIAINLRDALPLPTPPPWLDERYLKPTVANDPLLEYDFESISVDEESPKIDLPPLSDADLIKQLTLENEQLRSINEQLQTEKEVMRNAVVRLLGSDDKVLSLGSPKVKYHGCGDEKTRNEDNYYFESYDDIGIHAEMIKDVPRTGAYERAILENSADFKGKTVLDLGCGTGILSLFCAWAGASIVHAIDCSNIIYDAMENVYENNACDKIHCHKGRLETMELDIEKVDILVSEFMGYFLVYEGMLNSYIFARDKYLKPGGKMLPSSAEMLIVAVSDEDAYGKEIDGWKIAYKAKLLDKEFEAKMSSMKTRALKEPAIQEIKKECIVSDPVVVKSLDLHTCTVSDSLINQNVTLEINRDCTLTAIGGFFSVGFEDGSHHNEMLSTSPVSPSTHWKQCVFYLPKTILVAKGDAIPVHFVCRPHPHNERWLAVNISVSGRSASYEMR